MRVSRWPWIAVRPIGIGPVAEPANRRDIDAAAPVSDRTCSVHRLAGGRTRPCFPLHRAWRHSRAGRSAKLRRRPELPGGKAVPPPGSPLRHQGKARHDRHRSCKAVPLSGDGRWQGDALRHRRRPRGLRVVGQRPRWAEARMAGVDAAAGHDPEPVAGPVLQLSEEGFSSQGGFGASGG